MSLRSGGECEGESEGESEREGGWRRRRADQLVYILGFPLLEVYRNSNDSKNSNDNGNKKKDSNALVKRDEDIA